MKEAENFIGRSQETAWSLWQIWKCFETNTMTVVLNLTWLFLAPDSKCNGNWDVYFSVRFDIIKMYLHSRA